VQQCSQLCRPKGGWPTTIGVFFMNTVQPILTCSHTMIQWGSGGTDVRRLDSLMQYSWGGVCQTGIVGQDSAVTVTDFIVPWHGSGMTGTTGYH
jgi:hypothetical protein